MITKKEKLGSLEVEVCDYDLKPNVQPMDKFDAIYIHGTVKHNDIDDLLNHHLSRGFAGIGYHFALKPDGKVYSTRPLSIQGAHCYGRNKNSVGILIFDINSNPTERMLRSFRNLYEELIRLANIKLHTHSHTYGQFEYLFDKIERYNQGLPEELRFKIQTFDDNISLSSQFIKQKDDLVNQIIRLRKKGIPKQNQTGFQQVLKLIDQLKLCPSNNYNLFVDRIKERK